MDTNLIFFVYVRLCLSSQKSGEINEEMPDQSCTAENQLETSSIHNPFNMQAVAMCQVNSTGTERQEAESAEMATEECNLFNKTASYPNHGSNDTGTAEKDYICQGNLSDNQQASNQTIDNGAVDNHQWQSCGYKRKLLASDYVQPAVEYCKPLSIDIPSCSGLNHCVKRKLCAEISGNEHILEKQPQNNDNSSARAICSDIDVLSNSAFQANAELCNDVPREGPIQEQQNMCSPENSINLAKESIIVLDSFLCFCNLNLHLYLPSRQWKNNKDIAQFMQALGLDPGPSRDMLNIIFCLYNVPISCSYDLIQYKLRNRAICGNLRFECTQQQLENTISPDRMNKMIIYRDLNKLNYLNEVDHAYKRCMTQMNDAKNDNSIKRTYFDFLLGAVLYKSPDYSSHVLRKELFTLPYFMPELYFYISYRVKCLFNAKVDISILKREITQEVELLICVITEFCVLDAIAIEKIPITQPLYIAIDQLRHFTLHAETNQGEKGINLKLYAYAIESRFYDKSKVYKLIPANILFILTFLLDLPCFPSLSSILALIINESQNLHDFNLMFAEEIFSTKMCKRELYVALHIANIFLNKLFWDDNKVFMMITYTFKVLQGNVAVITYSKRSNLFKIHFLSDIDFLCFISTEFDLIYYK